MFDDPKGILSRTFDSADPAYWSEREGDEAYFGAPPISPARQMVLEKAAELTLEQRIQMRIKHGTNWHNKL